MRYDFIDNSLFKGNRERFVEHLKPHALAVFNANDVLPTNADGTMPFKQNSDLFYMTGIDQEETILLLFPDSKTKQHRTILFVRETSAEVAIWEGHKLTKKEATAISGIDTVYWTSQFEHVFSSLISEAEYVYLNSNEHTRSNTELKVKDDRFALWCRRKYPLYKYERSAPIMHKLRVIKNHLEVEMIQKACDITERGFRRILSSIKPGIKEYEIEAELSYEFLKSGSRGFAYQPIIASGIDSCILHYISNDKKCSDGEIILLDIGAEYANYNADLTRVVPVGGKFTKRQRSVYKAVERVLKGAINILLPGKDISEYQKEVIELVEKELVDLGLLSINEIKKQDPKNPVYRKYFMHGISHFLGLDVHDVGNLKGKLEEHMVLTVEPGIYIREEGIGIRLENDVMIKKSGILDFMENVPLAVEEIEELMNN